MKSEQQFTGSEIEQIICVPFEKAERQPMTEELTSILIQFMMVKSNVDVNKMVKRMLDDDSMMAKQLKFLFDMFTLRHSQFSYKFNNHLTIVFLLFVCQTPGTIMLYLWYFQYWCKKHNKEEISLNLICTDIFPMGFPKEEELHKIWDAQKVKKVPDNLIDYTEAGKSLFE